MLRCGMASYFGAAAAVLIVGRAIAQIWLERLNRRFVLAHSSEVPEPFRAVMDEPTFRKATKYTLAKTSLNQVEIVLDTIILGLALFSEFLPWFFRVFTAHFGASASALAAFIFTVGVLLAIVDLPLSWYAQFRLEERFGFNTTTQKTWCLDRIKGLVLA